MTTNLIRAMAIVSAGVLLGGGIAHADTSDTPAYKEICKLLDGGVTPNSVANMLQKTYGATLDTARLSVMVAIDAYCPSHQVPNDWKDWTGR